MLNLTVGLLIRTHKSERLAREGEIEYTEQNIDSATKQIFNNILLNDSLINWHLAIIAYNDSTGDSLLKEQSLIHYSIINNLHQANLTYEQILSQGLYTSRQLARQLNEDVEINTMVEENLRAINEIRLKFEDQGDNNYDSENEMIISEIAHQCPQAGGNAVVIARALYALKYPNEFYDDKNACLAQGIFRTNLSKNELDSPVSPKISYFSVSPNPASEEFSINYFLATNSSQDNTFELYNAVGQKIKSISLSVESKKLIIKCDDLENGMYFYSLKHNKNSIYYGKVTILKN